MQDSKFNVLLCIFELPTRHMEMLRAAFNVVTLVQFNEDRIRMGKKIDALIYCMASEERLTRDLLHLLPNLQTVCFISRGVEQTEVELLQGYGIKWTSLPDLQSDSCADLVFGLILASARRIIEGAVRARDAKLYFDCYLFLGREVSGSTLGIIGMGSIGYKVAERAKGFHMKILYHNRHKRLDIDEAEVGATFFSNLRAMLPLADILVVACPLTKETRGMIGREELGMMKSSAIIVNIARGSIIDTDALVDALRSDSIRAAALDTTDPEPLPHDHPLLEMSNVLVKPHIGSATWKNKDEIFKKAIENVFVGLKLFQHHNSKSGSLMSKAIV